MFKSMVCVNKVLYLCSSGGTNLLVYWRDCRVRHRWHSQYSSRMQQCWGKYYITPQTFIFM